MGGGGQDPLTPQDPPLSSLLMKPQAKIDKIYLSVFEEMKNPKWKMSHIWYFLPLIDQIHIVLQYIDIFQRMLHINKKQSYGIFFVFEKSTF